VKANQATHSVGAMCRLLHISRSGFYAWLDRPMSDRDRSDLALTGKIEAIHRGSKGVYGSPNIHAELADDHGIRVERKRVGRLMRSAGLRGATLRRYVVTTLSDPGVRPEVDLVERQFYADGPDRLWVSRRQHLVTVMRHRDFA
jgi:putative transposase